MPLREEYPTMFNPGRQDRWMVEIRYLPQFERPTLIETIEELEELHNLVEGGPNWNEIDAIVVTLNRPSKAPQHAI